MKKLIANCQKGFTAFELLIVLLALSIFPICLYGWVQNIITVYHSDFNHVTGQLVLRIIGIPFVIIGIVMGYL